MPLPPMSARNPELNRMQSILRLVREHGCRWRPWLIHEHQPETIRLSQLHSRGVMCSTVQDARQCCSDGEFRDLLLTELPGNQEIAREIVTLGRLVPVTATIDHFYHAELLSRAAGDESQPVPVVILVDIGAGCGGVRAGYDAQRLAVAVNLLPGLRVAGLLAELSGPNPHGLQQAVVPVQQSLNVLAHTASLLRTAQIPVDCIRVIAHTDLPQVVQHPVVGELCTSPESPCIQSLNHNTLSSSRTMTDTTGGMSVIVVSRPSLQFAVISAGWRSWYSLRTQPPGNVLLSDTIRIVEPHGAEAEWSGPDTTVLKLSGAARDLTIGDPVRISLW